jgi:superfamily II DNA/RNA helicase
LCRRLTLSLSRSGWPALAIHGDKQQQERDWVLQEFKSGRSPIMIATDVASRGLDVKDIKYVINYDFPNNCEDYIHRIGRTGRGGATGTSYTYFTTENSKNGAPSPLLSLYCCRIGRVLTLRPPSLSTRAGRHPARIEVGGPA